MMYFSEIILAIELSTIWGWVIFIGSFLFSGFLVALESALHTTLQIPSLSPKAKDLRESPRVQYLLEHSEESLIACEIIRYIFIAISVISGILLIRSLVPVEWISFTLYAALLILFSFVFILFSEIIPRSIAVEDSDKIVQSMSVVYFTILRITFGTRHFLLFFSRLIRPLQSTEIDPKGSEASNGTTGSSSEPDTSVVEADEYELIDGVLDFHQLKVKDILIPRAEVVSYSINMDLEELRENLRQGKFSRVPVYEDNPDELIGILHLKDILLYKDRTLQDMIRKPLIVTEQLDLHELLKEFQRSKVHIAIVYDQFNSFIGLVTLHDLLEEIVGKIQDEEEEFIEPHLSRIDHQHFEVSGMIELADLSKELELNLSESNVRTLNGYVMEQLDRIPETGDVVELDSYQVTVREVSDRSVLIAEIKLKDPVEELEMESEN